MHVRDAVSKSLETLRSSGEIGGALDASVTVYTSGELQDLLAVLGDELRFVLITSKAQLEPMEQKPDACEIQVANGLNFAVHSEKTTGGKCVRCWHLREDVGTSPDYPEVCSRCISNVHGDGESRKVA